MRMTIEEFTLFAERCVSEDVTRPALAKPFRAGARAYVTDGRIALALDLTGDMDVSGIEYSYSHIPGMIDKYITDFCSALSAGKCEAFSLDATKLRTAAAATFADLKPHEDYLRTYEADPDDPDDVTIMEALRFVHCRYSRVILPDRSRTVIAGYYAADLADIFDATHAGVAYIRHDITNPPICARGANWTVMLMPLRNTHEFGETRWLDASAIADAATGELLHSYGDAEQIDLDTLRFPREGGAK